MIFFRLSQILESIENTSSRNDMTMLLVDLYNQLDVSEVSIVSYLLQGRVAPYFVNSEFQVSEKILLDVAKGINSKLDVQKIREEVGDIGLVFEKILQNNKEGKKEISTVYEDLWKVINARGTGSATLKINMLIEMLKDVSGIEGKYLSRMVCGNLRLGASDKTLLDTFSIVLNGDKAVREVLDYAYGVSADIGYIAQVVMKNRSVDDVASIKPTSGVPILSRLVERAKSFEELIERMGDEYIIQPKFDGLRLQIHKSKNGFENSYADRKWYKYLPKKEQSSMFGDTTDTVRLFTRNLEDVTGMFPEIVESANNLNCESVILDSEVIGWNSDKKTFLSYQETMTRKRKYGVESSSENVPVRSFVFDMMLLNGDPLVEIDTSVRLEKLRNFLSNSGGEIVPSESFSINTREELEKNFNIWVSEGLEGLIAKKLNGGYTPGGRNFDWIKLKKSFMNELSDSVDVVVLGYYLGSGKRTKFGIGALLCGVYNEELDRYESITKLGTGITDEMFGKIIERLKPLIVEHMPNNVVVDKLLEPDVWVFPEVVCTVEADDITKAINKDGGESIGAGLSLRFPRLIEFDRDKKANQATTVSELISLAS